MTTGTVTMSLADIDALRESVKNAKAEAELAKKELVEVKADKRIVKEVHIEPTPIDKMRVELYKYRIPELLKKFGVDIPFDVERRIYENWHPFNFGKSYSGNGIDITPLVNISKTSHLAPESNKTTSFINLDDVKTEMRNVLEKEYNEEVGTLRSEVKNFEQKNIELQKDFEKERKRLQQVALDIQEGQQKKYEELEKKYVELETGKKEESAFEELKKKFDDVVAQLAEEKNKKWYQKF